jgi:hypothetical protein
MYSRWEHWWWWQNVRNIKKVRLAVTTFLPPPPVFCSAVHVQQMGTQVKIKRMFCSFLLI